jgi:hypothetical protein
MDHHIDQRGKEEVEVAFDLDSTSAYFFQSDHSFATLRYCVFLCHQSIRLNLVAAAVAAVVADVVAAAAAAAAVAVAAAAVAAAAVDHSSILCRCHIVPAYYRIGQACCKRSYRIGFGYRIVPDWYLRLYCSWSGHRIGLLGLYCIGSYHRSVPAG